MSAPLLNPERILSFFSHGLRSIAGVFPARTVPPVRRFSPEAPFAAAAIPPLLFFCFLVLPLHTLAALPPVPDAGTDQNVVEGYQVILNGGGSVDPDGDILSWKWEQLSGTRVSLSSDSMPVTAFIAPTGSGSQELIFQLTVEDDEGLSRSDSVAVYVSAARPPVADAGEDIQVDNGDIVTLNGAGSYGVDAEIQRWYWEQVEGPDVTLSSVDSALTYFQAPVTGSAGASLLFRLTVMDARGFLDKDEVLITVGYANQPPVASAGDAQLTTEGRLVLLDGSGSYDLDGGIAGYQWKQTDGASVELTGADSVRATFTAPETGTLGLFFELTVWDQEGLIGRDDTYVVVNAARPPIAVAGSDQTVSSGDTVILDGALSYAPSDQIASWRWEQVDLAAADPVVTIVNDRTAAASFSAPLTDDNGVSLTFELTVADSAGRTGSDRVMVQVTHANQPPRAAAGSDLAVYEGGIVTLSAGASHDPDGGIASYEWTQLRGTPVTMAGADTVTPYFIAPPVGADALVFQLTVTDIQGLSDKDDLLITVNDNGIDRYPDAGVRFYGATGRELGALLLSGGGMTLLQGIAADSVTASLDRPSSFPYGLFQARFLPARTGGTVQVRFYFPEAVSSDMSWTGYNATDGWYRNRDIAEWNEERTEMVLTLTDGGSGDDGEARRADGEIHLLGGIGDYPEEPDKDSLIGCFISASFRR